MILNLTKKTISQDKIMNWLISDPTDERVKVIDALVDGQFDNDSNYESEMLEIMNKVASLSSSNDFVMNGNANLTDEVIQLARNFIVTYTSTPPISCESNKKITQTKFKPK